MTFVYPCPGCRSSAIVHDVDCRFDHHDRDVIEKAYTDILSVLIARTGLREATGVGTDVHPSDESWLEDAIHGDQWLDIHDAVLARLQDTYRVEEINGQYQVVPPAERRARQYPRGGLMGILHEHGACDGCLDTGVSAMVSWCEMEEFDWQRTREFVIGWLHETGTWTRGSFEERSPEELVRKKKHIHDRGIGWKEFALSTVAQLQSAGLVDAPVARAAREGAR